MQLKITIDPVREPVLHAYFAALPNGSRSHFLRMALKRAIEGSLLPDAKEVARVTGGPWRPSVQVSYPAGRPGAPVAAAVPEAPTGDALAAMQRLNRFD